MVLNSGLADAEEFTSGADLFSKIDPHPPLANQPNTPGAVTGYTDDPDIDPDTDLDNAEELLLDAVVLNDHSDNEDGCDGSDDENQEAFAVTAADTIANEMNVDDGIEMMVDDGTKTTDIDEGIETPRQPYERREAAVLFQAGCVWTRRDWSCAYDVVFTAFFAIYWQSSASWHSDWRRQSPEWSAQLANHFDSLLEASNSPNCSPEGLSKLFSALRDQFRNQLSSHDSRTFCRRGAVPASVCAILELLFGDSRGPSIEQQLLCTGCGTTSQVSHHFPLLAMPVFPMDYRCETDPQFVPADTLLARFVKSLAISPLCVVCHRMAQVQYLSMTNYPWIWFETEDDHTMSPSPTVLLKLSGQHLIYDLYAIIYLGGTHFTARIRDPSNEWWKYDGMWKFGAAQRDHIQIAEDLLYNGRRRASFLIYRRSDH